MPPDEHVHIISAGENIHTAYPAIFRMLPSITCTYVLADSDAIAISPNKEIEKQRLAVRHAIIAVKEISASLFIPCSREIVFPPVYSSVRTVLTTIHRRHPGARFTFDLSGGSKELCLALLAFAPWLGGEVYAAFDGKTPRTVPLPDRSVKTLMTNPNYQMILALLLRTSGNDSEKSTRPWVSREYLFKQLWSLYQPSRMKKAKTNEPPLPVIVPKTVWEPATKLTHGTLSTLLSSLEETGLVAERVSEDTKRRKDYQVTESGEIAFRFFAQHQTGSLVQMVLEKK